MVDLSKCNKGDRLLSRHGMVLIYIEPFPENNYYDHRVQYPDGGFGTRMNDGYTFKNPGSRMSIDHDIVEVLNAPNLNQLSEIADNI